MSHYNYLEPEQIAAIEELVSTAASHDGVMPLSEHVRLHIQRGGDEHDLHFLMEDTTSIMAYAHLDMTDEVEGPSAELVVRPDLRGRGFGTQLMREVTAIAGDRLRLWSHGDLPAAAHLADRLGLARVRTLLLMSRDLHNPINVTHDLAIRTFLPGLDESSLLSLNARAFAEHPEQGNWSQDDLMIRMKESWFDPHGIFLHEIDGQLAAFCWTKIHGSDSHGHANIGEIYVVGVDPDFRGRGLGAALTQEGLRYLQQKDAHEAILYVDAENRAAVRMYETLGFATTGRDVLYRSISQARQ